MKSYESQKQTWFRTELCGKAVKERLNEESSAVFVGSSAMSVRKFAAESWGRQRAGRAAAAEQGPSR